MSVLTETEFLIATGQLPGNMAPIAEKLDKFQESKTTKEHIAAINLFIPEACKEAGSPMKKGFDKKYHKAMMRLNRAAGLRA